MTRPDFVEIELTAAGVAQAGEGGSITVNGRTSYTFKPGVVQEVDRNYTWLRWLSKIRFNGQPALQIAVAAPAEAAKAGEVTAASVSAAAAARNAAEAAAVAKQAAPAPASTAAPATPAPNATQGSK